MLELPKRSSLIAATAASIRKGIREGVWGELLPGERALCEHLQVSRTTLRSALNVLTEDGLLSTDPRRKRRIVRENFSERDEHRKDLVALVANEEVQLMAPMVIFYINELRRHLQKIGLRLEIFTDLKFSHHKPEKRLLELLEDQNVACWVLISPTTEVQRFFSKRHLPTLVVGPSNEEIPVPSIGINYQAVCRHAAGVFLSRGHQRLALVIPDSNIAGNTASERGFLEGVERGSRQHAEGFVLRHDSTPRGISRKIELHLRTRRPATAFLICRSLHALTATSHLLSRGISIPDKISVISRDSESYIDYFMPEIARYHYGRAHFARKLARLVVRLATEGSLPPRKTLIFPDLIEGQTLATGPGKH